MPRDRAAPRAVNSIRCVGQLVGEWDGSAPVVNAKSFSVSPAGNINHSGEVGGTYADIFTPDEPQFAAALEPGIRPLVTALTNAGFMTYTSCEGHLYDGSYSECHVGILPCTTRQLLRLLRVLGACRTHLNPLLVVCRVAVYPWYLYDEASTRRVAVVDVYLHQSPNSNIYDYFEHRSKEVQRVAKFLQEAFSGASATPQNHVAR